MSYSASHIEPSSSSQRPKSGIGIRYISHTTIQWIGNKPNDPRSVAAILLLVNLLLIDIKCHCTTRSHNSNLVLLTQTDRTSRTITSLQRRIVTTASEFNNLIST